MNIATNDTALFQRAMHLRDHGRRPGDRYFFNTEVAFKYKMSSMQAALGLAQLERMGEKSAANLVAEIEKSRTADLWRVLHGIGIRHVGEGGARALARAFVSITAIRQATIEQLGSVPDVGPVVARSVRGFLDEPANAEMIDRLVRAGVRMEDEMPAEPSAGTAPRATSSSMNAAKGTTRTTAARLNCKAI